MSHDHSSSTSSDFQLIFDNALKTYKKCTKNDLLKHPLADWLQACDSPNIILTVLQEQVQELNESHCSNTKWLEGMKDVHGWIQAGPNRERPSYLLRDTWRRCRLGVLQDTNLSEICTHICLKVFSPAKVIFIGFGVLLLVCTLLNPFVRSIVIQMIHRQLRPFARTKTLFLRCSSP
jgi:hypothetical protein